MLSRRLFAALALSALAIPAAHGTGPGDHRLLYTSQHRALTEAWADAFTAKTGIPVAIRKGTDILMANQIVQEGLNSPADIFLTENSPAMVMVEQARTVLPGRARNARTGARRIPPQERHVDRHRRAHHAVRLQYRDAEGGRPPQVDARPRQARVGGPLGRRTRRRRLPGHRLGFAAALGHR